MDPDDDVEGEVGPLDTEAMGAVREAFLHVDGLVNGPETGFDSVLDPTVLTVTLEDGVGDADWSRFDVKWYRTGHYNCHHVDENGANFRFDFHPKVGAPDRHFHPPPDADSDDAIASCIEVAEPRLVARAVHAVWRRAYEFGSFDALNTARNPP